MPWPMRLGPPPRMMTFSRSVGSRLALGAAGASRRPRRSSTCRACRRRRTRRRRCRCACRPGARRGARRCSRDLARRLPGELARAARRRSPCFFSARELRRRLSAARALRTRASSSTISSIWREEPGIDTGTLRRSARRRGRGAEAPGRPCSSRSGVGCAEGGADDVLVVARPSPRARCRRSRSGPVSIERSAFCSDSGKVRPMAMTSPTDFIAVVSVGIGAGELLEGKARDLGDDVVDGRLERGRRRAR